MTIATEQNREMCGRCRRPRAVCYCAHIPSIPTRTRLVFLQHPRERWKGIGTARMAHLALPNSELHVGVGFMSHPRIQELASRSERPYILFPGPGARPISDLADAPETLIVADGTWSQARKIVTRDPLLSSLPRVAFTPTRPGNYRIRKEPAAHCVSTIEAVVEALGYLEGAPERFRPMLRAFDFMVDRQLDYVRLTGGNGRKRAFRRPPRPSPSITALRSRWSDVVLVYAEANSHRSEVGIGPELIQLVAERPAQGDRLELVVRPRKPLGVSTCRHTELDETLLASGLSMAEARARLQGFRRGSDVYAGWGYFTLSLLAEDGEALAPFIDLRVALADVLKRAPGDLEIAASAYSPAERPWGQGRAGRRLAAISTIARQLTR